MRYSDIKVGNIYFVNLEPVQQYEFGGNHLGIVLRKGTDRRTVTIVSLTSNSSGVGENKLNIGVVSSLPRRLVQDRHGRLLDSYVVLDQVRTVVANRVQNILDGTNPDGSEKIADCPVGASVFSDIVRQLSDVTIANLNDEDSIRAYHKDAFFNYSVKKMINLTYDVLKGNGDIAEKDEIKYLYNIVLAIKADFCFDKYLNENDVQNKVSEKFSEIVSPINV